MAEKRLTLKEIQALDFQDVQKLNKKQLSRIVSDLNSVAKKRIKTIEKNENVYSFAVDKFQSNGGIQTTKNKSINELRQQFIRVNNFVNAKTSTVTGSRKVFIEMVDRISELTKSQEYSEELQKVINVQNITDLEKFWDVYNNIIKTEPAFLYDFDSNQIQEMISNIEDVNSLSFEKLLEIAEDTIGEVHDRIILENETGRTAYENYLRAKAEQRKATNPE